MRPNQTGPGGAVAVEPVPTAATWQPTSLLAKTTISKIQITWTIGRVQIITGRDESRDHDRLEINACVLMLAQFAPVKFQLLTDANDVRVFLKRNCSYILFLYFVSIFYFNIRWCFLSHRAGRIFIWFFELRLIELVWIHYVRIYFFERLIKLIDLLLFPKTNYWR